MNDIRIFIKNNTKEEYKLSIKYELLQLKFRFTIVSDKFIFRLKCIPKVKLMIDCGK